MRDTFGASAVFSTVNLVGETEIIRTMGPRELVGDAYDTQKSIRYCRYVSTIDQK